MCLVARVEESLEKMSALEKMPASYFLSASLSIPIEMLVDI